MPEEKNGAGHMALLEDIRKLLSEAESMEFHDFCNRKYATPKVELRNQLLKIADQVVEGRYDN